MSGKVVVWLDANGGTWDTKEEAADAWADGEPRALVLQSDLAAAIARAEADARDAARWRHAKDELTYSYGDGHMEPWEYGIHLEWQQGPWIRDGSNDGRGRADTFPGWDAIVDEMIAEQARELADDAAIAAQQAEGEDRG